MLPAEKIIQTRNKQEHHHDKEQNSEEVTNQFAPGGSSNLLQLRNNFTEECKNTAEETELLIALRRCAGLNSLLGGSQTMPFLLPLSESKKVRPGNGRTKMLLRQ